MGAGQARKFGLQRATLLSSTGTSWEFSVSLIEAALRGGAVVLLILVSALLLRDARRVPAGVFGALFALGTASYTIVSASVFAVTPPSWLLPLQVSAMGNPVVFCLLAATLFDDDFKPSWLHAVGWLSMVMLGVSCLWIGITPARWIFSGFGLACNALGVWYVLAGRAFDLVEARRRLRAVLLILVALYSTTVIASEIALPTESHWPLLYLANGAGLLATTSVFAVVLLSISRDGALISVPVSAAPLLAASPRRAPAWPVQGAGVERDEDTRQLMALRRLMEYDKAYREEGLSIGGLAAKLGISEHALRRLINQRLEYRNFNAFLNGFRLDDAIAALADPAQEAVPILTIALDAGFQSLGPFNRAFKAQTGMTPTEFRGMQLRRIDQIAAE
jgi:AraC-like DNA-binding protein